MFSRKLEILAPTPKEAAQLATVAWLIVTAISLPAFLFTGQVVGAEWFTVFWGAIGAWLLTAPIYFLVRHAIGRPLWLAVPAVLAALVAIALVQMALDYGGQYLVHLWAATRIPDTSIPSLFMVTVVYFLIDACVVALFLITGTMNKIRIRERELAEAQVRRLETELHMLRLQLNPHFLGNSLNVISSLILTGRTAEANRMAEGLADFLSATMALDATQISLGDELETVEAYLELESARFGERLTVEIHADAAQRARIVPSFVLQPLVENAIKHGVEASPGPCTVRIAARSEEGALLIAVENRGEAPAAGSPGRPGHGIGLANTRARLALLFGDEGVLETGPIENGWRAAIRLPARASDGRLLAAA
ncbi:MAG: histidine kinase [Sphingomonas sp.]|uniref:sensor histidine kinase n=1 Tax=Sphingomonas sp. TaxID=28214 RepID=UPI0022723AF3|nr:histidine kinase [Sphingomonas sp.]MCX8477647.1 histidine kinase [Sphingomonas sp.]